MNRCVLPPGIEGLARLAQKYRFLGELRRARERGEAIPSREIFRDLADEFPGALRELDTLPLDTIDRRAHELEATVRGDTPVAQWMQVVHAHHVLLRAALLAKRHVRKRTMLTDADAHRVVELIATRLAVSVDVPFVVAVHDPPEGRLGRVVVERIATGHALTIVEVRAMLFPPSR